MNLKLLGLLLPLVNTCRATIDPKSNSGRTLEENPTNHYCGLTWPDAFDRCPLPCPSQQADECAVLGSGYDCFGYTGCNDRVGDSSETVLLPVEEEVGNGGSDIVENNKYCGASW